MHTPTKSRYPEIYAQWQRDPEAFWREAAEAIDWVEKPKTIFDAKAGVYGHWFPDGVMNTCYNAVDRHAEGGRGDQIAFAYDSPVSQSKRNITYKELQREVSAFGAILRDFGIEKGDRVVIYMPMIPEALVAMLACARIGAIHSVVFGGFAPKELATRLNDARPKLLLTASCGIEVTRVVPYKPLLDAAIEMADCKPEAVILLQRPQAQAEMKKGWDWDWASLRETALAADRTSECVPMKATDPLYILYTSGTTGKPKGVVRDNGGHAVALKWSMEGMYGIKEGEVW